MKRDRKIGAGWGGNRVLDSGGTRKEKGMESMILVARAQSGILS